MDVEGAEADVLRGADFSKARPKIIMVEAIKPFSLAPAWDEWEPMLAKAGYAYVWDDELNRYYVAEEARALTDMLAAGPKWYADGAQIGNYKPAADDATHPDHRLARLLAGADMAKLPLTPQAELLNLLTAGLAPEALAGPATEAAIAAISSRLFGPAPACAGEAPGWRIHSRCLCALHRFRIDSAPPAGGSRRATPGKIRPFLLRCGMTACRLCIAFAIRRDRAAGCGTLGFISQVGSEPLSPGSG